MIDFAIFLTLLYAILLIKGATLWEEARALAQRIYGG